MEFREQIIEYRKQASSIGGLSAITDTFFLEKYGVRGTGGSLKFDGVLVPGNVYFFTYETDSKPSDKISFIDRNPLILYISSEKIGNEIVIKSIDLTITPPENRLEILKNFWDKFSQTIELNSKETSKGRKPSEIRLSSKDLPQLFQNTGYNLSFTGFKYKFMKDIKFVDYSDWAKLPYLKYSSIQGIPINEIYSNYRSKLKDTTGL